MSTEYKYTFGQWVLDDDDYKYRYLGKRKFGDYVIIIHPESEDTSLARTDGIRPDPDPPEFVAGQLVMVKDDEGDDWKGPYKYMGCDSNRIFKHAISDEGRYRHAKPYIPSETPESERPTTEQRLDSLEKRITEVITQMQTLKTNTKP